MLHCTTGKYAWHTAGFRRIFHNLTVSEISLAGLHKILNRGRLMPCLAWNLYHRVAAERQGHDDGEAGAGGIVAIGIIKNDGAVM